MIVDQITFDPIEYGSRERAKYMRDQFYRMKKAQGYDVRRFVLKNQLRPYSGLGQPDGTIRDIFIVEIRK